MSSFSVACFFCYNCFQKGGLTDQFRKVAFDGLPQHSNASKQSDTAIEFLVYLGKKYLVTGCGWTEVRLVSASSPWVVAWWAHRHFLATSCRWPPWHDLPRWWWQQWCWWWWWGWGWGNDDDGNVQRWWLGGEWWFAEENFCDVHSCSLWAFGLEWVSSNTRRFLGTIIPTLLRSPLLSTDKLNFLDTRRKISHHPALSVETLPFSVHHLALLIPNNYLTPSPILLSSSTS